jgi:glycosyltransferase involved in cell wall biosynthesis
MDEVTLVVPGPLGTRTGGSIYDRRVSEGLRHLGWGVDVMELVGSFPLPTPDDQERAAGRLAALSPGTLVLADGLAFGSMPDIVTALDDRLRFVALVHLPLAAAVGLDAETSRHLAAGERRALTGARLVVVTGAATPALMAEHGLTHPRVVIVEPGTDRAPLARGSGGPAVHLVCVGTVGPGKGHDVLIDALDGIRDRDWRLTCAGSLTRYPETAASVRGTTRQHGLEDRITFTGELDETRLADLYDTADVFVLATLRETWGMAVAEALARGLPVVSTATGAIPSLVVSDAGAVVPPGDTRALSDALAIMVGDATRRARAAETARRVRERLPGWDQAALRMAAALKGVSAHG